MIDSFKDQYLFLSNFYPCILVINDYTFRCSEAAYQAAKSADPVDWARFQYMNGAASKQEGRKLDLPKWWDQHKLSIMREILEIKFSIPELRMKLLNTQPNELVEGNYWGDTYWGVCRGQGENHLGKILMQIREELQGDLPW